MRSQGGVWRQGKSDPRGAAKSTALFERLLGVNEAAVALGVKPATLYQWAYQRRIPVVKLFGPRGALRFREGDIRALIARSVRHALGGSDGRGLDLQ